MLRYNLPMPSPKVPCPQCGQLKSPTADLCRSCRPSYERTPEHRAKLSAALTGKPHSYRSASTRPEVAAKIAAAWTPERREAKRQAMLLRNPNARYHGLSAKEAKRRREAVGACQSCGSSGRLDIHHRDRNKRNQDPANLAVLCHRCHMQEHARAGETGFDRMHQRRKSQRGSAPSP
jgi:5-methylcytosine-specific restriction endonuclease McrA